MLQVKGGSVGDKIECRQRLKHSSCGDYHTEGWWEPSMETIKGAGSPLFKTHHQDVELVLHSKGEALPKLVLRVEEG